MIIDDNNYINGVSTPFDLRFPYVIVLGAIGIGKSQYSKVMSQFDQYTNYYSVQQLCEIARTFRKGAKKIIEIRECNYEHASD